MGKKMLLFLALTTVLLLEMNSASAASPMIDSIIISPAAPDSYSDVVCTIFVSDADGDLDFVRVRWIVDSAIEKTTDFPLSGSAGGASDTLGFGFTNPGSAVKCRASVFDVKGNSDTLEETVSVAPPPANTPPDISGLPDRITYVGNPSAPADLWEYSSDAEDPDSSLTFAITLQTNPDASTCSIEGGHYMYCPGGVVPGSSEVSVQVTDTGGLTDMDTFTVTVNPVTAPPLEHSPDIVDIGIAPTEPEDSDDLTCNAEVSDADGDLDSIRFEWFVNSDLFRVRTKDVSGSHDGQHDVLDEDNTDPDDIVRCEVTVYDMNGNADSADDSVYVEGRQRECGVTVTGLTVNDDEIRALVSNVGDDSEHISYRIYVEDEIVKVGGFTIHDGHSRTVRYSFPFSGYATYKVRVKASSDCGASDSETIYVTILNEAVSSVPGAAPEVCGLDLESLDYINQIRAGERAAVTARARNTGSRTESLTLSLYLDDENLAMISRDVKSGDVLEYTFYYYPDSGTHSAKVTATSTCGGSESKYFEMQVLPGVEPPYREPEQPPEQPEEITTTVNIIPSQMDMKMGDGEPVTVQITSAVRQIFEIKISGAPPDWFSYKKEVLVEKGKRNLYIYVSPDRSVKTTFTVTVKAAEEEKEFSADIGLYVAPREGERGLLGGGLTGMLVSGAAALATVTAVIILSGAFIIYLGWKRLKIDVI